MFCEFTLSSILKYKPTLPRTKPREPSQHTASSLRVRKPGYRAQLTGLVAFTFLARTSLCVRTVCAFGFSSTKSLIATMGRPHKGALTLGNKTDSVTVVEPTAA